MRDVEGATFIGRRAELARLARLWESGARVVTIVGPPGTGKSRLALEAARSLEVWRHLEGAALADEESRQRRGEEVVQWADAVGRHALVVIDDVDPWVPALAACLGDWLARAPRLSVCVTSRQRLRVAGEHLVELAPLSLPPLDVAELARLAESEAGALFLARAAPLEVAPAQVGLLAELLHRLDGIPLAIELAAVRASVLDLGQLCSRLERRFELLSIGARGGGRQATLSGAIDWSWSLLDPREQRALAQCAVFRGSFSLVAAEAVIEVGADARSVLDLVHALVDKSLLQVVRGDGETAVRYRLYDSIRDFASGRLGDDERAAVELRHAQHFASRSKALGAGAEQPGREGLLARIAAEMDDLLAAFERGLTTPSNVCAVAVRAGEHLARFEALLARQARTGPLAVLRRVISELAVLGASRKAHDPALRAALLRLAACACAALGRWSVAERLLGRGLELARDSGDALVRGEVLYMLGATMALHPHERRLGALVEALAVARQLEHRPLEAKALAALGGLYLEQGRAHEALAQLEQALGRARALGWRAEEALLHGDRAAAHGELQQWAAARAELAAARALHERAGEARLAAAVLGNVGAVAHEEGKLEEAEGAFRRAIEELARVGARRMEGLFSAYLGGLLAQRDRVAEARASLEVAAARAAAYGEAVDAEIVECHRAGLLVAEARQDASRERQAAARVEALGKIERPWSASADLRAARRLLARAIGDTPYSIATDGSWFCAPNRPAVSLARRRVLQRLLMALVAARDGLSAEQLIKAAWPHEQMSAPAAHNRLHVALTTLRNLGLRELLVRRGDGYGLAPDAVVELADSQLEGDR